MKILRNSRGIAVLAILAGVSLAAPAAAQQPADKPAAKPADKPATPATPAAPAGAMKSDTAAPKK